MDVDFDGFIATFENVFDNAWIDDLTKYYHTYNDLGAFQGRYRPKHLRDDEQLYLLDPVRIHDVHPHYSQYFFNILKEQINMVCDKSLSWKNILHCLHGN